jgi:hypothetical protein
MSKSEQLFSIGLASAVTYIFTAPTCTITIITHELCALNAEFQHFILRFNKIPLPKKAQDIVFRFTVEYIVAQGILAP